MQFPGFEVFLSACLPLKRGYRNLCNQYTWNEYWRWEVHEIVDGLKEERAETSGETKVLQKISKTLTDRECYTDEVGCGLHLPQLELDSVNTKIELGQQYGKKEAIGA